MKPIPLLNTLSILCLLGASAAESPTNHVLRLDGRTGYMTVAHSSALESLSSAMTLELWFAASSFRQAQGAVHNLLRKNVIAGNENFFLRFRMVDGHPVVEAAAGSQVGVVRAPFDFKPGRWHHLAMTFDGSTLRIFVDGVPISSEPRSGRIRIDNSDLVIGKGDPLWSEGEYFDGALDEIRIWNVALPEPKLKAGIKGPLRERAPGLVAYWNFDEGTAEDGSGNDNGGALKGEARIEKMDWLAPIRPGATRDAPEKRAELTVEQRLKRLDELWQRLRDIYPALEYKGVNGPEWIRPALERTRRVKDDEEFYGVLLELIASLKDTHTRIISYPGQPRLQPPPVWLNEVEGKIAVIRAHPSTGVAPGDLLVAIEGEPATERLAAEMTRVCNSTDRGRVREACGRILAGAPGTTITATFESAGKSMRQVSLLRGGHSGFWNEPTISSRALDEKVAYIRIARWGGEDLVAEVDRALERFRACDGLIIDVRGNGGGDDRLADQVNGRFTDQPVVSSIDFWRQEGTDHYRKTIGWVQPRGPWMYRGRVAVLIDEGCASACEHFVSGMEALGRVLLVGMPTNGAGGGPTVATLSDGTRVVISRALGMRANGVVFEGHGIPPHLYIAPALEDLRQGTDRALARAKEWLNSGEPLPARQQPLR